MNPLTSLFKFIFSLYGFAIFLLLLLILFPFVLICSFFGRIRGGNLIYDICRLWADIAFIFWGFQHTNIYETLHDNKRPVVFVFNHISYMDIPVIMKTFRKQHIRILGKAELAKVPIFGFIYRHAAILVDRSNAKERAKSVRRMIAYLKKNISIVIAPEGTFNMSDKPLKEFYNGAFKIAIETQTPIKPVIFLDANDRLNHKSIFSLNPGKSRSVFLEEIPVAGLTMKDMDFLKDKVYLKMEAAIIKYHASWVSIDKNERK